MAKIYFSALINNISGRLGDITFGKTRGIDWVRTEPATRPALTTPRALQVKANFSAAALAFTTLSPTYVSLWDAYALKKRHKGGGRAAHRALNCNLLNASHAELSSVAHPPHVPGTPKFPRHFCVTQVSPTSMCITWSAPVGAQTFVTGHFRTHYGFCKAHPCWGDCPTTGVPKDWHFLGTARADQFHLNHVHHFPANTRLFYRLNSIDKSGRKSPFTHVLLARTHA